jgi:hypothetical protein
VGGRAAVRGAMASAPAPVARLDSRALQPMADLREPPHRFHRRGGEAGAARKEAAEEAAGQAAGQEVPAEGAAASNVLLDSASSSSSEDEGARLEHEDPRDARAAAHLDEHHPRGAEPGAGLVRSAAAKQFVAAFRAEEWAAVHTRVRLLGCRLARMTRESFERKRQDLDAQAVFHPDANRVRVESQLAVKLARELQYPHLEGMVVEQMMERERLRLSPDSEKNKSALMEAFTRKNGASSRAKQQGTPGSRPGSAASRAATGEARAEAAQAGAGQGQGQGQGHGQGQPQQQQQQPPPQQQQTEPQAQAPGAAAPDEEDASEGGDEGLLTFDQYRLRAARRERMAAKAAGLAPPTAMPIEDFIKARVFGMRGGNVSLRDPRKAQPIGKERSRRGLPHGATGGGSGSPKGSSPKEEDDVGAAFVEAQRAQNEAKEERASESEEESQQRQQPQQQPQPQSQSQSQQRQQSATKALAGSRTSPGSPGSPGSGASPDAPGSEAARAASAAAAARRRRRKSSKRLPAEQRPELLERLGELFQQLEMSPENILDFCIKYSEPKNCMAMADAIECWSDTAVVVTLFERIVVVLELARARRVDSVNAVSDEDTALLQKYGCYVSMAQMFGATCAKWIEAILAKLGDVTQRALAELEDQFNDVLTYRGVPYREARFSPQAPEQASPHGLSAGQSAAAAAATSAHTSAPAPAPLKQIKYAGNSVIVRLSPLLTFQ